ncbi:MAG: aminotransferase class I/II-fold pyridoxal phosphate-dependent enzyme [Deltaproteobacteria bacterium]|nr:aminotransferase class I/II-fold pyridoxal phosphate-dependent enzyme [Deltaproteobacteria bacterium]
MPTLATASRLRPFGTSIFSEMTALATAHGAINLSQGFPDFEGPDSIREAAIAALRGGANQYARSAGRPELAAAIAAHVGAHRGIALDPTTQVVVTSGCTEALMAMALGVLEPGDEVITFEPFYDAYPVVCAAAGATLRPITLRFPELAVDLDAVRAAITPKTRMLLINTPHNPSGKVFSRRELSDLAAIAVEHDLIVVTDEVYEHLVYDVPHVTMAELPGMAERTLVLSSAGKSFSYTGWKIGWAYGPAALCAAVQAAHQFLTFCSATPLQLGIAHALAELPADFYAELSAMYRSKRDFLVEVLQQAGFRVGIPDGTYFVVADFTPLFDGDDRDFCRWLTTEHGVAAIPPSVFYSEDPDEGRRLVRFAFCKTQPTLDAAAERLLRIAR